MLNNSTLTAAALKTKITDLTGETIQDSTIRLALNFFYSLLGRAEAMHSRSKRQKVSGAISVTASGYDLSQIPDIASINKDFHVFKGALKSYNEIHPINPESDEEGYFILGETLYLTNYTSDTIYVRYSVRTTRVEDSTALSAHTLEIDRDLEETVFNYCLDVFYKGQFQRDLQLQAEEKYMEELERYFKDTGSTSRVIRYNF